MTDKPVVWLIKFEGKPIGLHWHGDLAHKAADTIKGAVVVPLYERLPDSGDAGNG